MTASLFWQTNGLNELADAQDFVTITRRINGGTNGLADRQMYYTRAKNVLAAGFVADPLARGAARSRSTGATAPLTRGYEAISRSERVTKAAATRSAKRAPVPRAKA